MSSHHFVKEDQEPALLIVNPTAISFERIQELLEWSPTVIVNGKAVSTVQGWGIKIDMVLCLEEQQEELAVSLADQVPIRFITFAEEMNILSVGYDFLRTSNYKAVNVLVERLADLEVIQRLTAMDVEAFFDQKRWVYIESGKFKKWLSKGNQLSIYPIVQTTSLNLDQHLTSMQDGKVKLESASPFWVAEELT
jgi:thiamine pyrophosphokinase